MTVPYVLTDVSGAFTLPLNSTFYIAEHESQFGWGLSPTPRSHGDRAQDRAYLNGKGITLRGFVGAGVQGGSVPWGWPLTPSVNSTLSSQASPTDDVLLLASVAGFQPRGGLVLIEDERCTYTGVLATGLAGVVRGVEGSTAATHASGVAVTAPPLDSQYLDQLRAMFAHLHTYQRGILDYRNGWYTYVLFEGLKDVQAEGWPDTRAIEISLKCEDPLSYALPLVTGVRTGTEVVLRLGGNSPSTNYRLLLRSGTSVEQLIKLTHVERQTVTTLTLPAVTSAPLVLNGWQRTLYLQPPGGVASTPAWSRWTPGSVLPVFTPGYNQLVVQTPTSGACTLLPLTDLSHAGATSGNFVHAELTAHSADWLTDSLKVPYNTPPGTYDLSQYDINVYA